MPHYSDGTQRPLEINELLKITPKTGYIRAVQRINNCLLRTERDRNISAELTIRWAMAEKFPISVKLMYVFIKFIYKSSTIFISFIMMYNFVKAYRDNEPAKPYTFFCEIVFCNQLYEKSFFVRGSVLNER